MPSGVPQKVHVESKAALSLDVSWQEIPVNKRNGRITGYKVYYKKTGSQFIHVKVVGPSTLSCKLNSLEYAYYHVQVSGHTSSGNGPNTTNGAQTNEGGMSLIATVHYCFEVYCVCMVHLHVNIC